MKTANVAQFSRIRQSKTHMQLFYLVFGSFKVQNVLKFKSVLFKSFVLV